MRLFDWNGDSLLDVMALSTSSSNIGYFQQSSNFVFSTDFTTVLNTPYFYIYYFAVADFDQNGTEFDGSHTIPKVQGLADYLGYNDIIFNVQTVQNQQLSNYVIALASGSAGGFTISTVVPSVFTESILPFGKPS